FGFFINGFVFFLLVKLALVFFLFFGPMWCINLKKTHGRVGFFFFFFSGGVVGGGWHPPRPH
ncbi:hypothetical protein ACVGXN_02380, partial [Enterobacter hormaechei]